MKPTFVVSFHTTTDALAMKALGKRWGLAGRLAPIPRQLSAGCGLAWHEPAENQAQVLKALAEAGITPEGTYLV